MQKIQKLHIDNFWEVISILGFRYVSDSKNFKLQNKREMGDEHKITGNLNYQ